MAENGALLEPAEFLYLLATVGVTSVFGLDNAALFPARPVLREARLEEGLALLKSHGWLRPAPQPGRWDLDDGLLLMASVVAEPMVVILTVRNLSRTACQLARHYVWENTIVELSQTPAGQFQLAIVADLPAATERIGRVLALPASARPAAARTTVDETALDEARRLAAAGNVSAGAAVLQQAGVSPDSAAALAQAMAANDQGGLVTVMALSAGRVAGGRRAMLFQSGEAAWLAVRASPDSQEFIVERTQASAVTALISEAVSELAQAKEPVP